MVVVGGWTTQRGHEAKITAMHTGRKWGQRPKHTRTNIQAKQTSKQTEDEEKDEVCSEIYFHLFILWLCCLVGPLCQKVERGVHWTFLLYLFSNQPWHSPSIGLSCAKIKGGRRGPPIGRS
jgi:hypothetical protein